MNSISSILRLIRFQDQIFVILAILIAGFFHSFSINKSLFALISFTISLLSFTFALDDISDIKIDRLQKNSRNPIVRKEMSLAFAQLLALMFFILTLMSTVLLPVNLFRLSLVLIFISMTYSIFIKAKARPPLDLIYHGSSPTIIFIMASSLYRPFDTTILLSSLIVFNIFLLIQILLETRDFNADKKLIKTTVVILGIKNSIKFSIFLLSALIFLVVLGMILGTFPFQTSIYLPLSVFLFQPLIKSLKSKNYVKNLLKEFRIRLIVTTIVFAILFLLITFSNLKQS